MIKVIPIKAKAYIKEKHLPLFDNWLSRGYGASDFSSFSMKRKLRKQACYYADRAYEIVYEEEDCEDIFQTASENKHRNGITPFDVIKYARDKGIIKNTQQLTPGWLISSFNCAAKHNDEWCKLEKCDKVIVFDRNDFKQCQMSDKQIKLIRKNSLMKSALAENLKSLAKSDGINLLFKDDNRGITSVYFADSDSYKKVVVPAIQNYVRELVEKLGGDVEFAKAKSTRISAGTRILKLTDVKIKE